VLIVNNISNIILLNIFTSILFRYYKNQKKGGKNVPAFKYFRLTF